MQAACWFSLGFARALAASDDVQVALEAGLTSVLSVTEPGRLDDGTSGWVQKFELGDPEQVVYLVHFIYTSFTCLCSN